MEEEQKVFEQINRIIEELIIVLEGLQQDIINGKKTLAEVQPIYIMATEYFSITLDRIENIYILSKENQETLIQKAATIPDIKNKNGYLIFIGNWETILSNILKRKNNNNSQTISSNPSDPAGGGKRKRKSHKTKKSKKQRKTLRRKH